MDNFDTIRELRSRCGASISHCKKALEETGGDIEKALAVLRREGASIAAKKASRATHAGVVDAYVHADRRLAALIKVKCETDFVARNEEFRAFAHDLAMQAAAMDAVNVEEFLEQPFIKDPKKTVHDLVKEVIAKFGENVEVISVTRLEL
ncbi:MAG: translation elongation factor Ts [Candidatus Niyogibacteria bacterium]|nr:translation elongation factor Ts [Candidatus Niyogibacteria bacterium]